LEKNPLPVTTDATRRRAIGFLNWAHAIDHFVILIFPTVVIGLEVVYGRPYSELIALGTASFVAFGVFSLPAGWLADRWSRRNMMAAFYIGCGLSLASAAFAPDLVWLAVALFALGVFAAIYHPVGMAMLIEAAQTRGRTLAFNGVCGNLGAALAAGISAALASWFGWRWAFLVPGALCVATGIAYLALVPDDRHKAGKRDTVADFVLSPRAAIAFFGIYIVISATSGLTFNTLSIALPKIVDERLGVSVSLLAVGTVATAVFMCGALAQLAVGRLVERFTPVHLYAVVVGLQLVGIYWAAHASGVPLVLALALSMASIYGQVTVGDLVMARYTADAWRGRAFAVRYFLTFVASGAAVSAIALLHRTGGFDLVLMAVAGLTVITLAGVTAITVLVSGVERRGAAAVQPAE
jgi:predicted MFS family arabinose efflux permease